MLKRLILWASFALTLAGVAWGNVTGAVQGTSGVPGEGTCADCHGIGAPNSGPGKVRVSLVDVTNYQPGGKLRLRVTLEDPNAARWGFNLTARTTANPNTAAGTFSIVDAANTRMGAAAGGPPFVTHTLVGTRPGTSGSSTWEVDWTGPSSGDSVTFYVAGNAANNNNQPDAGDRVYTSTLVVTAATTVTTTSRILPQFVFGGGFYTAIYLHNTGSASAAVKVSFFGNDGAPLNVPALGGTTTTKNIASGGMTLLEAPNTGDLQQGWAKIDLPDGVIGYGVFRQSVQGRADQEAVVPFSGAASSSSTLIFDDSGLTTAVAVANPSDSAVALTVSAKSNSGTSLGSTSVNLPAKGKTAFTLSGSIAAVAGQRGSATFAVSSGSSSALGLRFGGEAFTSIPAFESTTGSGTRILPQFVFGGGFYTAIYLHNTGGSSATANISFFGNNGQPLNVPGLGGTSTAANIAAGGVALLEALNIGDLQQGWAKIDLPAGVIGYGVFRQSIAGRADQEAVVPFAGASSTKSTMIFDEVGLTTAIAAANPTDSAVTVNITAKSDTGTTLGTASIDIPARGKSAFTLSSTIGAARGQRGSVDLTASTGAVSVIGLRFGGEAFTSIPATER